MPTHAAPLAAEDPEALDAERQREAEDAAKRLEQKTPAEILRWASSRYGGKLTMATSFGPEGCVMIDMIAREGLRVDIFTLDTGLFFPETYALWRRLEERYGLSIRGVQGLSLAEQEKAHGPELWKRDPNACCQLRKVKPLRETLATFDAWLTGIRRDQTAVRRSAAVVEWDRGYGLFKVNPMLSLSEADVQAYIRDHEVPQNTLQAQGYKSIGCHPCTTPVKPGESERAGRWRGQEKTECGIHLSPDGKLVRGGS